jgi:hypothetical protein
MYNLIKYTATMFLVVLINKSVDAQEYDNIYRTADADMVEVRGNTRIEHTLKGAVILLPNSSNQLSVTMNIPYNAVNSIPIADPVFSDPGLLFQLKVNIDPWKIQNGLTSAQTFPTNGSLTLNNITKTVTVKFIPMPFGTEEDGNFKIFMIIQFSAGDFGLAEPYSHEQFIIKINDAKVNRV